MACMSCLAGLTQPLPAPLEIVEDPEQAAFDAACKLSANFKQVVKDITNPGPKNIEGKALTQTVLTRVDPAKIAPVRELVSAVCCRLVGKIPFGPSSEADAKVWAHAAVFLQKRLQGSAQECPGRAADMSLASATEMRSVLAEIEAASRLMFNREYVVLDITNPGPSGVSGKPMTQRELKRVDRGGFNLNKVRAMVDEVSGRLLGKSTRLATVEELGDPSNSEEVLVWAQAASFLGKRVQAPESAECEGREPDMSTLAAGKLRVALAKLEAAHMLMSNRERVVQDITNKGPRNIEGKKLTQKDLARVDQKHKGSVDKMVKALVSLLLGQAVSGPHTPEEALAWKQAAVFLAGRVQGGAEPCPGRAPDMSPNAATMMKRALGQIEAFGKLMSNRDRVIHDIVNPAPKNIEGKTLTQKDLKRVDPQNKLSVDVMINEVCSRLLGNKTREPNSAEAKVWAEAAKYLSGRIQSSKFECRGRAPDMGAEAAAAMRKVLASIHGQKSRIDAASLEAAQMLMANRERVVLDITNEGPKNIEGRPLTQQNLRRVPPSSREAVDTMVGEVCRRLLGKETSRPSGSEVYVWEQAAAYLSGRIQGSPDEMPGRTPDMGADAAAAMRRVLATVARN